MTTLFVVCLWAFFALWAYQEHVDARVTAGHLLERQRIAADAQVNNIFKMAEVFVAAADRWVSDHPHEDPRSNPQFRELVLAFQRVTDASMMVRLVSDSGELYLIPPDSPHKGVKVDDRDYFRGAGHRAGTAIHWYALAGACQQALGGAGGGAFQPAVAWRLDHSDRH